jgi:hypothetical protein
MPGEPIPAVPVVVVLLISAMQFGLEALAGVPVHPEILAGHATAATVSFVASMVGRGAHL